MKRKPQHPTAPSDPSASQSQAELRHRFAALAVATQPHLPITNAEFLLCSNAIAKVKNAGGPPLHLPGDMLPPL